MIKSLIYAIAVTLTVSACKKVEEPALAQTSQITYPVSYNFIEFRNPSEIQVFTKTQPLNAPDHPTTKNTYVNNFNSYRSVFEDYFIACKVKLISSDKLELTDEYGNTELYSYSMQGNKIICIDGTVLTFQDTIVTFAKFYGYARNYNSDSYPQGVINSLTLEKAVQEELFNGDTAAVRSYDAVLKKQ